MRDLEAAWKNEIERSRHLVTRNLAIKVIAFDIAAPRARVWEHFTVPGLRPKWRGADEVRESSESGRRGVGTTNHCMHGSHAIVEEVLDWRPFDYFTLSTLLPAPGAPKINLTFAFADNAGGGTHVEIRVAKPKPKDRAFLEHASAEFEKNITGELATLRQMLEATAAIEESGPETSPSYRRSNS